MTEPRKKLSEILHQGADRENLSRLWKTTAAAEERGPLPPGEYTFRVVSGELFTAKRGTPGYKLTLEVAEGDFEGRRAWCDFWLTPASLPMTKRDLAKLGITDLEQLERPLPAVLLIRGKLALRRDDDGNENNKLVRFECIGVAPGDAFEPGDDGPDQSSPTPSTTDGTPGANGTPPAKGDGGPKRELFPFGANAEADDSGQAGKDFHARQEGGRR
jgi:hypothetical protein